MTISNSAGSSTILKEISNLIEIIKKINKSTSHLFQKLLKYTPRLLKVLISCLNKKIRIIKLISFSAIDKTSKSGYSSKFSYIVKKQHKEKMIMR